MTSTSGYSNSAASRALNIPEVVSIVLAYSWSHYHSFHIPPPRDRSILTCIRVNSLWFREGIRHMWRKCGGYRMPRVLALEAIDDERQQLYANCIQKMIFDDEVDWPDFGDDDEDADEEENDEGGDSELRGTWGGYHITVKPTLSFPRLRKIHLKCPFDYEISWSSPLIRRYLVPHLRSVRFTGDKSTAQHYFSEGFLLTLVECCSYSLKELCLGFGAKKSCRSISPNAFANFLQNMNCLSYLLLGTGLISIMSADAFRVLAQQRSMQRVEIPEILDEWILCLQRPQQDLVIYWQCLITAISDSGLKSLLPYLGHIRTLGITTQDSPIMLLPILGDAHPVSLRNLSFTVANYGDVISASQLLAFAKVFRNLEVFSMAMNQNVHEPEKLPSSIGLNDSVVDGIAKLLPNLEYLDLVFSDEYLGRASLISLGRHCPRLESCWLTALVDCTALLRDAGEVHWPSLVSLYTGPYDSLQYQSIDHENPDATAIQLLKSMPRLRNRYIAWDCRIEDALDEIRPTW